MALISMYHGLNTYNIKVECKLNKKKKNSQKPSQNYATQLSGTTVCFSTKDVTIYLVWKGLAEYEVLELLTIKKL